MRSREILSHLKFLAEEVDLHVLEGNMVVEIKNSAVNKGSAATKWLDQSDFDFVMAIGDDRTDEDQLGASYDELEWAMKMQEEGRNLDQFVGRDKTVFEIYTRLNKINQHKIQPIPLCEIPPQFKD